jgi:hypothetical protein
VSPICCAVVHVSQWANGPLLSSKTSSSLCTQILRLGPIGGGGGEGGEKGVYVTGEKWV